MREFAIVADVTCDLTEELQQRFDISVVPGHMTLPGGVDKRTEPAWTDFTREGFYAALKKDPDGFTTAPPNVAEFAGVFAAQAEQGRDVLVLTISGGMSGTINFARQAAQMAMEEHPGLTVKCVDSLRFGPACGLLAMQAARLREQGKTLEETCAWLEENKNRLHQAGWLDDLSFVAKKGRMTHSKAFFGTLVGVKPIGEFDYNGMTTIIAKIKGAKAAYAALLHYVEKTGEDLDGQTVIIAHTDRLDQAEKYKAMIEERFHPGEILILDVHPACGVSIGPGLMAAYYMGRPISEGLTEERAILEKYTSQE